MKNLLLLAALLTVLNTRSEEKPNILDRLSTALPAYLNAFPLEKVYVQTDKDIYSPGEIIWFRALITSRSDFKNQNLSPDVNVNLYDASGNFITGDKYLVDNAVANGDIKLPAVLTSGRYYLVAFTPLQTEVREAFIKPILVDQAYQDDVTVRPENPDKILEPGKESEINLIVRDHSGQPADRFQFDYSVEHDGKILSAGKLRSVRGNAPLLINIPENIGDQPLKLILKHPKNLWNNIYFLRTYGDKLSVAFYPEGGNLINNMPLKMGYYVTAQSSVPVELEADILDDSGRVIVKTATFMPGFGLFPFKAEPGQEYKMIITSEYGKGQIFDLPEQNPEKVALTVTKAEEGFLYADIASASDMSRNLAIVVTEKFNLIWAASFDVSKTARVRIPVTDFGPGIQQISVFDHDGQQLASRLVYTPKKQNLRLDVSSEVAGDQVRITVKSHNGEGKPVASYLSVAVADNTRLHKRQFNIDDYQLFNGELIHPVAGFSGLSEKEENLSLAIDYLLIINNLKNFSWGEVLNYSQNEQKETFIDRIGIRGKVANRKGEPSGGARINIMNSRDMQMYSAEADENGFFIFPALNPVDFSDYTITATEKGSRGALTVELEPSFSNLIGREIQQTDSRYAAFVKQEEPAPGYYLRNPSLIVKAPSVVKPAPEPAAKIRSDSYKSLLQTSTSVLEVIKMIKPYQMMGGQIVFYGTQNSFNNQSGALIVIDGQKMGTSADVLNMLAPNDVESINISLDPMDIQKYTGLNNVGVIEISTKKGETVKYPPGYKPSAEVLYKDGYRIPRNFLSAAGIRNESGKDMRTTLLWNPNLETGPSGSITFSIPLSEVKSEFEIYLEGTDISGNTGNRSKVFKVE
jgi:hypothetical protein